MSDNTLIIYLKNPKIKKWLKTQAKENHTSLSAFVSRIVEEKFDSQPESLSKFLKYFDHQLPPETMDAFEKSMEVVRESRLSKPDSYYENLFKE